MIRLQPSCAAPSQHLQCSPLFPSDLVLFQPVRPRHCPSTLSYLLCHCNCCFQKPWPQLHCPPRSVFSYLLDSTQPYSAALSHPYSLFLVYSVTFADCNLGLACSCYVDGRRKPRGAMWFNSQHVIRSIFSLGSDS